MSIEVVHAGHDGHAGETCPGSHGSQAADPSHEWIPHASRSTAGIGRFPSFGSGVSPLWWSASHRLACAVLLIVLLWLVIGWAVA